MRKATTTETTTPVAFAARPRRRTSIEPTRNNTNLIRRQRQQEQQHRPRHPRLRRQWTSARCSGRQRRLVIRNTGRHVPLLHVLLPSLLLLLLLTTFLVLPSTTTAMSLLSSFASPPPTRATALPRSFSCTRLYAASNVFVSEEATNDDDDDDDYLYDDDDIDTDEEEELEYGKFEKESKMHAQDEEEEGTAAVSIISPLYAAADTDEDDHTNDQFDHNRAADSKGSTSGTSSTLERRMEEQQRQIDALVKLVQLQQQQPSPPPPPPQQQQQHQEEEEEDFIQFNQLSETPQSTRLPPLPPLVDSSQVQQHSQTNAAAAAATSTATPATTTTTVAPLKAMLFIDGTWLYYSIYERSEERCPIVQKYGRGWQSKYAINWAALVRVISSQLQLQHPWNNYYAPTTAAPTAAAATMNVMPQIVEISRASVYTSCKRDTSKHSNRIKMFDEMRAANFDVFMMETIGPGEKCVDIQLAVEMLHYATVPNAYDVAILLSGDKDFLPALIRTRQKGRKVAIASFHTGCNRALVETDNVKDYDVIWIDDYLDSIMVPREDGNGHDSDISIFTMSKVIYDFIEQSGLPRVSSRDIGRYLKKIKISNRSLLTEMKESYRGLHSFLVVSRCFDKASFDRENEAAARRLDPTSKAYWAVLHEDAERMLLEEAKETQFTPAEKEFFETYSPSDMIDDESYVSSRESLGEVIIRDGGGPAAAVAALSIPQELQRDYTHYKLAELKQTCRDWGLPVSGTKAVLLERIQDHVEEAMSGLHQQQQDSPEVAEYLAGLLKEYIQARGGKASSRDIGRYLASNAASAGARAAQVSNGSSAADAGRGRKTALTEMKEMYGGLNAFVKNHPDSFQRVEGGASSGPFEFLVALRR